MIIKLSLKIKRIDFQILTWFSKTFGPQFFLNRDIILKLRNLEIGERSSFSII